MASSLTNLASNLAEAIHILKRNYGHGNKKWTTYKIGYEDSECCLEYTDIRDELILCKCLCCKTKYQKGLMKIWIRNFLIHTNFVAIMSISLLCCCKKVYMDDWKKFNERLLTGKENFTVT